MPQKILVHSIGDTMVHEKPVRTVNEKVLIFILIDVQENSKPRRTL